ncbi:MAG: extracellular solute-binding protein, partial [Spirochaetales bacterium]|nr:extracellular solute-binding protein [Spirochaetales bacterium]
MLKKVLIVMISLMLISSVIFAAGSEESSDTEKELVNVTMMIRDRSSISWDGSDLQDLVAEKFNLNIEMDVIDYSAFADKFAVRFNSGDIPDMANFHGINPELVNEAGDRGLLLNFLDYTDFMPNLNNYLVEYQDDLRYYLSNENKLYFAPLVINYPLGYYGLAVRKDLLDNAGFDINNVEDFDDLYKMFSILQEANDGGPVMGSRYTLGNIMQLGEFMG